MTSILADADPNDPCYAAFLTWRNAQPKEEWAKFDLSAARLGFTAAWHMTQINKLPASHEVKVSDVELRGIADGKIGVEDDNYIAAMARELLERRASGQVEILRTALETVRAHLIRLAWEENSLMIEGIDKALSASPQPLSTNTDSRASSGKELPRSNSEIIYDGDLLRCPACSAANIFMRQPYGDARHHIECTICRARGPEMTSQELAAQAWNDMPRALSPSPAHEVGEAVTDEMVERAMVRSGRRTLATPPEYESGHLFDPGISEEDAERINAEMAAEMREILTAALSGPKS